MDFLLLIYGTTVGIERKLIDADGINKKCVRKCRAFPKISGMPFLYFEVGEGEKWCQNGVTRGNVWFYYWENGIILEYRL